MPLFTPSFRGRVARCLRCWVLLVHALGAALVLPACAQPPVAVTAAATTERAAQEVSVITLEEGCHGCPSSTRLELRRDGTALLTTTGNAKLGLGDSVARARLPLPAFEALAQRLLGSGFFEMAASYQEPGLQDGRWATLSAVRGAQTHAVFRREDAGPAALQALLQALATEQARLRFVPDAR